MGVAKARLTDLPDGIPQQVRNKISEELTLNQTCSTYKKKLRLVNDRLARRCTLEADGLTTGSDGHIERLLKKTKIEVTNIKDKGLRKVHEHEVSEIEKILNVPS